MAKKLGYLQRLKIIHTVPLDDKTRRFRAVLFLVFFGLVFVVLLFVLLTEPGNGDPATPDPQTRNRIIMWAWLRLVGASGLLITTFIIGIYGIVRISTAYSRLFDKVLADANAREEGEHRESRAGESKVTETAEPR